MFQRFSDPARIAIALAQKAALNLKQGFIGAEHVLLALLSQEQGIAVVALANAGIQLEAAHREIASRSVASAQPLGQGPLPFNAQAKRVCELASDAARAFGQLDIGTAHLLLGILAQPDQDAVRVLITLGADVAAMHKDILDLLGAAAPHRGGERRALGAPATLVLWRSPVPTASVMPEPTIRMLSQRRWQIVLAYTVAGVVTSATLTFTGVEAFRCTYLTALDPELFSLALDQVIDLAQSPWLDEITARHHALVKKRAALRHLVVGFDDGPFLEFVCTGFQHS